MKTPRTPFPAFAILPDCRRRGGVRVARVVVQTVYELGAAEVVDRLGLSHWLNFGRLFTRAGMKRAGCVREKILTAVMEFSAAASAEVSETDESEANPPSPQLAGSAPAAAEPPAWLSRADCAG